MAGQDAFVEYSHKRLGGRLLPADLRALLQLQWQRPSDASDDGDDEAPDPLDFIDARLLGADEIPDLLDHSYLRPKDLQNPDIAANVEAIKKVCEYTAFVAEDTAGDLYGYWFGPEQLPIELAPVVRYDTEGCFRLVTGQTLAEALLGYSVFGDADEFTRLRDWFAKCGVVIRPDRWEDATSLSSPTDPDDMHSRFYNEGRVARGLRPIED